MSNIQEKLTPVMSDVGCNEGREVYTNGGISEQPTVSEKAVSRKTSGKGGQS